MAPEAELPPGSGGPVLAGAEAIFVAGRVEFDAPTVVRVGAPGDQGDLILGYSGEIATLNRLLRIVTAEQDVLGKIGVPDEQALLSIFLTDLDEPDEICSHSWLKPKDLASQRPHDAKR